MISPYLDITLFCRSDEEHRNQLTEVLDVLRKHNISLNLSKCPFVMKGADFLGYHLSPEGVKPQRRLTDVIRTFPRPSTSKDLKCVLRLTSYYREFIPMFTEISSPLNTLTSD